jgi:hypothetical protein
VALRNRLIHGYDSVDPELIWDLVQNKVPALMGHPETVLNKNREKAIGTESGARRRNRGNGFFTPAPTKPSPRE